MEELQDMDLTAPNLVSVCIDGQMSNDCEGRMYCIYFRQALKFRSICELLDMMNHMMEYIDFPKSSLEMRSYSQKKQTAGQKPIPLVEQSCLVEKRGKIATFLIHVQCRQNATWQGSIIWVENKEKRYFRSELELIRLIKFVFEVQNHAAGG